MTRRDTLLLASLALLTPACQRDNAGRPANAVVQQADLIIARVEGEQVPHGLFAAYLRDNLTITEDLPPRTETRLGVESAQANAMSEEVKSRLLDRFLLEQALLAKAHAAGVEVSDEDLDKFSQSVGLGPVATLHEGAPFTEREYLRKYLTNCLVVKRYLEGQILNKIAVSEADALEYYQKHASQFSRPDRYRLRIIRVDSLAEAQGLLRQIGKDGATYMTVAASLSGDGEGESDQGKDLGLWPADALPEPFAVALAPLSKGQISGIVQDPDGGFNLIYVEDKIPGESTPFDKVKASLSRQVLREKRDQALSVFLREVQEKSKISIEESNLGFQYVARAQAQTGPPSGSPATPAAPAAPGGPS